MSGLMSRLWGAKSTAQPAPATEEQENKAKEEEKKPEQEPSSPVDPAGPGGTMGGEPPQPASQLPGLFAGLSGTSQPSSS